MKILTLDIETSPALADVWSLWKQNVSLSQLRAVTKVISFAAKWHGKPRVEFHSDYHDGHDEMVLQAHRLWDDADVVVHFNGRTFDMPHLRREFLLAGLTPPSPVQEIDLLQVVKRNFRFQSNKLQHVSTQLGLSGKVQHEGHELWVKCMAGDAAAWSRMRRYNKGDVVLTEQLYDRLVPWISNHPHRGLYVEEDFVCSNCGSDDLERRGYRYTAVSKFARFACRGCGKWSSSKHAVFRVDARGVAA